ncbi:MAG: sigma-70 family RNA polymerase sigma factor [Verrucomicrobiota bacterium]|nr:sigma-70 family RNA polymerase sigma factor [Verrucomicrobiota bacterium]
MSFGATQWSVISACNDKRETSDVAQAALAQLCRDYWPPLYSFVRRRGYNSADAQDLVQGFFAFFLKTRAYERTDRGKGKFRSFLLASMKHYMADVWDRERALKRGGGLSFVLLENEMETVERQCAREFGEAMLPGDRLYELRWAEALVVCSLGRLEEEAMREGKGRLFAELKPFLCGGRNVPRQEDVAVQLAMSVETLRSHLSRWRARYRIALRDEVRRTLGEDDSVDAELHHLCSVLATAS